MGVVESPLCNSSKTAQNYIPIETLSGKMMVFVYLETQDPRHEPRSGGGVSDNAGLSEMGTVAFWGYVGVSQTHPICKIETLIIETRF
jgi:hypothetical protein